MYEGMNAIQYESKNHFWIAVYNINNLSIISKFSIANYERMETNCNINWWNRYYIISVNKKL